MEHNKLIEIGYKWLMKRCTFVITEMKTINTEIPDAIGFKSDVTFLLEAKTSRSDYFVDFKKDFRLNPEMGVGDFRFYITPIGLIKIDELPNGWGLIEVNEKGKVINEYNPFGKGNIHSTWVKNPKNKDAEYNILFSALRRNKLK